MLRNLVLFMLFITVIAPILLYTDRLATFTSSWRAEFVQDFPTFEFSTTLEEPFGLHSDSKPFAEFDVSARQSSNYTDASAQASQSLESVEQKSNRGLSTTDPEIPSYKKNRTIERFGEQNLTDNKWKPDADSYGKSKQDGHSFDNIFQNVVTQNGETYHGPKSPPTSGKVNKKAPIKSKSEKQNHYVSVSDVQLQHLRDQLIQANLYLTLPATSTNISLARELQQSIMEVERALGNARKDSELPIDANEKLKVMEETLIKARQIQNDCISESKRLRGVLHSTGEQLQVLQKQSLLLTNSLTKTLPKGLHCLPLRLATEYHKLNWSQQLFPNQEKLEAFKLYHYAVFSDNVLATAAVVNSTITHAKDPSKHVFHIVTDGLNYASMRMWFLENPPGKGTIQVQNIEKFSWLNSSYCPVLKQLDSPSMVNFYYRVQQSRSDPNMKYRNPKYLSILNHLRFYLPEVFPKLKKILFLDDDIVVQKDLTTLWSLDLRGNVNGAVETCKGNFHRFDTYLNFSNPLISKNFDPRACGWAYGMNIFDLDEWKKKNITEVYHMWQKLNQDRQLWKLGTLPPGLITFWKLTYPIDRSWHVLGLGYNPSVNQKDIERAAVIHYNGNMKPWLKIGIPKYRSYWSKHVDYDHVYLRECEIHP